MADDKKVKEEATQILGLFQNLPRHVVFDLDYTLWPFYCECYYESDTPNLFPHARGIIDALKDRGIEMAIASRSPAHQIATTFLEKLGIRRYSLAGHTRRNIFRKTGIPFESILFFDDEDRNIEAVSRMGVTSVLVYDGVTLEALRQGLSDFSQVSSSNGRKNAK